MLHKALLSAAALIGLTGLASAADLAFKAPPPVYVSTWTGCYLGGHAGYGLANSTSQYSAIEQIEGKRPTIHVCDLIVADDMFAL
jgi:opacity protein-like surface antigen